MGKKLKNIVLIVALAFFCFGVYSQVKKGPPQPGNKAQKADGRKGPCGKLPPNSNGNPPPPPPGLCLPINDYMVPLLLVGIAFGAYKVWGIEEAE